jgi:16S rRNA (cytidine1402-2'-O)-methyltransferase
VLVVGRAKPRYASQEDLEAELKDAMVRMSLKAAATEVSEKLGLPRREVYQTALRLKEERNDD